MTLKNKSMVEKFKLGKIDFFISVKSQKDYRVYDKKKQL